MKLIGSLFIWDSRALIGPFNKSDAELGSPAPISVDLISNRDILTSSLLSRHLEFVFHKFSACF